LERNRDLMTRDLVSRQSFDKIETEIEEAAAELTQAEIELARQRDLVAGQSADRIRTDLQETEAGIAQTRAALARERARQADATIRAPFDGVAATRQVNVGDFVAAGGAIVTLVDLDPLEIAFSVPEKHKERLAVGLPVRVGVDAYPERSFAGAISYVSPRVDEQTRAFPVKAEVGNADARLNPGMFARVVFVTGIREAALTVPAEALIPAEGASSLFVVEGDAARKVPVKTGESVDSWVEVLDTGLAPGALVVVEGKFALRDGARVIVQKTNLVEKQQ
jgi:RND family efflux transporter MFP subunit